MLTVFDHSGSLKRMGGDQQLFQEMVGFLLEDAPRLMERFRAGVEANNLSQAQHAAHTLKGLISNFGASRAVAAAAQAEEFARRGDASPLQRIIPELDAAVQELEIALASHVPEHARHA